ncbi:Metal-sensitive transcriptional repressor [Bacillus sp. UNCCL13]|nr:Metal-sensitive transcriptional repressor [Bacillus sp. UNCCL13]
MMDYDDQIKNRLKRIEGQLRGILRMMDENKECKDVSPNYLLLELQLIEQLVW